MTMKEFLETLFGYLNNHVRYAVLRNFEGLPENFESRDIDLAIERREYKKVKKDLLALVEREGWKLVTLLQSDRLITWVVGHIDGEGNCDLVQLDFFFDTSVFGIRLISSKEVVDSREFNGKVYHANKEYEFLDKYLYDRAVGAAYPEKYAETRRRIEGNAFVQGKVREVLGCQSLEECDRKAAKPMLLHALRHNLGHALCAFPRFEYSRMRNYLRGTGFSIGFTGPDGAGKTTVIDMMIDQLGDVFRKAHAYFHFRPMLFGNLGDVAHSAGIKKEVDHEYDKPHRGGKTGALSSLLRLAYYSTDYILGHFARVKPVVRITRLAIFDRYYTDIICDSRRSRIYLSTGLLYRLGRLFIPQLDYNILLTASTDTILSRKRELDREGIEAINRKIDYLADKPGYYKIMNDGKPQEAVAKILRTVFEAQHKKNLKRL